MVNPPTYFCPECQRSRPVTDPCEHIAIEPDALPRLRELTFPSGPYGAERKRTAPLASVSPLVVGHLSPPEMFAVGVRATSDALSGKPLPAADALHLLDALARYSRELDVARGKTLDDADLECWRRELDGWQAIAVDELERAGQPDGFVAPFDPPRSPAILIEAVRRLAVLFIRLCELDTKG
jgi:hypothetical protein